MGDITHTDHCDPMNDHNSRNLKRLDLHKTFGSIKVKKRIEKRELLAIKDTSFTDEMVLGDINDDTKSLVSSSVIPPMNANAESVEEMYDIHNIVSDAVLETLQLERFVDSNGETKRNMVPYEESTFVTDALRKAYEKNDHHCCRILVYALYLMALFAKVHNLNAARDHRMICAVKNPTNAILKHIQERYSHNPAINSHCMMQDKLLCDIAVLCFSTSETVCIKTLSADLNCSERKVKRAFQNLNCGFDNGEAYLKLPKKKKEQPNHYMPSRLKRGYRRPWPYHISRRH